MGLPGAGRAMTLYQHIVVDWAVTANTAVKAALAIDPKTIGGQAGRTSAEKEVSRLAMELTRKMHELPALIERLGVAQVFGPRLSPMTPEEREAARL